MKKNRLITIILLVGLTSCLDQVKQSGYEINGIAKNIPDSTVITISANNKIMDSTLVIAEKFQFKGKVEKPTNVFLVVKNSRDYKSFWLENNKIDFIAEKDKFVDSKIIGSETQKEADIVDGIVKLLDKKRDSLGNILSDRTLSKSYRDSIFVVYNKVIGEQTEEYKKFVRNYPNSLVSTHILNIFKTTWKKQTTSELFSLMNKERQESDNGKTITRFIKLNKNPQIGEKYVDFEQANVIGQKIKLSDIEGKYILVEFWASWCHPCRMSNPSLVKEYRQYRKQGFEIFGVSLDEDKDSWLKAIKKDSLTWENVSDLKGSENEAGLIYGVNGIPDNILIDENGIIIGRALRGSQLSKKLEEVFKEKASL